MGKASAYSSACIIFGKLKHLNMQIENSTPEDIPEIFRLYELASDYQRRTFPGNVWPRFDEEMVRTEVLENRQFKIVIDGQIACIWAITFEDPQIWPGSQNDNAVYLHRIATNPEFRGNNFVQSIVAWAHTYAAQHQIDFIRMDTCGDNQRLIAHYVRQGFDFLGMKKIDDFSELPEHYHHADVCYFEIKATPNPS